MIRRDALLNQLKAMHPEMLFSPPPCRTSRSRRRTTREKQFRVTLKGLALFHRKARTTAHKAADSRYVSAWCVNEHHEGDCLIDSQIFSDFKKEPALSNLGMEVRREEFGLRLESDPFLAGRYNRITVKVVDVYGNESTVVRDLT